MSCYYWNIKALSDAGNIEKGMEVEVIMNGTGAKPSNSQIQDAYIAKHNIDFPDGSQFNRTKFEIKKQLKKPSFFIDQQRGYEKEIFIDYFLSWTLRCAVDGIDKKKNSNINEVVQRYSKFVLLTILKLYDKDNKYRFKDLTLDNTSITLVETEKQWEQIDLFCLLNYKFENKLKKYILVFENKMYAPLKGHQLPTYHKIVENHRKERYQDYDKDILKFFIHSYPNPNIKFDENEMYGFIPIHFDEISGALIEDYAKGSRTGNALFDEFWFNYI